MRYGKAFNFCDFVKLDNTGAAVDKILLTGEISETFYIKLLESMCFYLALTFLYVVNSGQK